MSDLLRQFEIDVSQQLSEDQLIRLRQISRQQRLPFVFKSSEVVTKLALTQGQREAINRIIEETRPNRGDRDRRDKPPFGFRPRPPAPNGFGGGDGPFKHEPSFRPFRGGGFEMARSPVTQNTVKHILEVLTPEQRTKWQSLIGEPFIPQSLE